MFDLIVLLFTVFLFFENMGVHTKIVFLWEIF